MNAIEQARFKPLYAAMLQVLKLQGKRPKTIEAYPRAVRRIAAFFDLEKQWEWDGIVKPPQARPLPDILTRKETFRYTENSGKAKTRTLLGAAFLWLLLQHVLPKGFRRTRDYGFLHGNGKAPIHLLHDLFRAVLRPSPQKPLKPSIPCSACGAIVQILATGIRRLPQPRLQPT